MSPVFYMFVDREKLFGISRSYHWWPHASGLVPHWWCGPGLAQWLGSHDREFLDYLPARLDHYDKMAMQNKMLKQRTVGIGTYSSKRPWTGV